MKKHPQLSDKLKLLYKLRLNPDYRTHADLARGLGISKQSISKWIHGSSTTLGDRVPHYQVEPLSRIFSVELLWWTYSLEDFEQEVNKKIILDEESRYTRPDDVSVSFLPITNAQVLGRDKELVVLDQAWQSSQVNILQLLAFGGVGKSTLVNAWLAHLSKSNYQGARRVYAWSFYWQGSSSDIKSSGDFFIENALTWFGDSDPLEGTPWAKAGRLVKLIRASRTLLILDGLEPLQHPPGKRAGQIDNPAVAFLVKELAFENPGLCLITSRIGVADLSSFQNGRVRTKYVDCLSSESSILMLRTMGIFGSAEDFSKVTKNHSGHALSLSLLAGYLTVVHRGNISKYRELSSLLDDQSQGDHARSLMQAYLDWFTGSTVCELLYLIGMFDRGVSLLDLKVLCVSVTIDGLTTELSTYTDAQWLYAIKLLCDSRIITQEFQNGNLVLDCHPLVRDFMAEKLSRDLPEIWRQGNHAIFTFLQNIAVDNPKTMSELEPLFRAVIHGTRAGCYEEAFDVYFRKIKKGYAVLAEGSHYADRACIRSFFVKEWSVVNSGLSETSKFHLIVSAAINLMFLGCIDDAIEPSYFSLSWFIENQKYEEATNIAGPLFSMLVVAGRLDEATELLDSFSKIVADLDNAVLSAMSENFRAYINYLLGFESVAKKHFEAADDAITKSDPGCPVYCPTVSSYYCKFLLDTGNTDAALKRALKTVEWRGQRSWQVTVDSTSLLASDLLVLGLILMQHGDYTNAKVNLDKQVGLFKSANDWLYLPSGLNARATYYIKVANYPRAEADLREALEVSQRTGARFGQWESYLNFSQLYLAKSDRPGARRFLAKAMSLKGMSDYKFRDYEIAQLRNSLSQI
jgi:tetratricopeptide (TPR) repeat protein